MKWPWLGRTYLSEANLCGSGEPLLCIASTGLNSQLSTEMCSLALTCPFSEADVGSGGAAPRNSQEEKYQHLFSGEFALGL